MQKPKHTFGQIGLAVFMALITAPVFFGCDINFAGNAISYPVKTTNQDFQPVVVYPVGNKPIARAMTDLNGDGFPDLVVLSQLETVPPKTVADLEKPGSLHFLLNDGLGAFVVEEGPSPGVRPSTLRVTELNGDGQPDLVLLSDDATTLTTLLNLGDGGWQAQTLPLGGLGADLNMADLNGDGSPAMDILVALAQPEVAVDPGLIVAFVNDGAGGLTAVASQIASPAPENTPVQMVVGDWNLDGWPDLAVRDVGLQLDGVKTLIGQGDGSFSYESGVLIDTKKAPTDLIVADLNNDGVQDLAISSSSHPSVTVVAGNGAGDFTPFSGSPVKVIAGNKGPEQLLAGMFTPEGMDLVALHRSSRSISFLDGDGKGGFTETYLDVGYDPFALSAADFNGDGKLDLLINENRDRTVAVMAGEGNGKFEHSVVGFSEPLGPAMVLDLDGNGMPDVIVLQPDMDRVMVLLNCHPAPGEPCP